jgi:rubrerythrin
MFANIRKELIMDIEDIIHELYHLHVPEDKMKHFRKAMKHLKKLIPTDRGQWFSTDGTNLYCSKCGQSADKASDVCPNCGTEMHRDVELRFDIYN